MRRLIRDERGATAIEYALLAAMIAAALVTIVMAVGETVAGAYDAVQDALEAEL